MCALVGPTKAIISFKTCSKRIPVTGARSFSLLAYYETKRDRVQFERQFTAVMRSTEVLPRQKVAIFESMSRAVEAGQYDKYLLYRHGVEAISLPGGSYPDAGSGV